MSNGNNLPRPLPPAAAVPPLEAPTPATEQLSSSLKALPPAPKSDLEEAARRQIASLEREAKALGPVPAAALLFHQIGLLWEDSLNNPRNAAAAYQSAFKVAPRFLANIRAARRLFSDVGNWQMVVQLLDAELAATEDPRQRAALLFEKGIVLEKHLARQDEAEVHFAQCLELSPSDVSLLVQLESVYVARNQYPALVQVYKLLASAMKDDAARAYQLTAAGLILENRLNQPEEADRSYLEAFKLNRRDPLLLAALVRRAQRRGQGEDLIKALTAQVELEGTGAANSYILISKAYGKLGLENEALSALLEARNHAPNDGLVLSELAFTYEERGLHQELAEVLLARAQLSQDQSDFAGINLRLAALYQDVLKQDEDAVDRYRAVLARVPQHAEALAGLGRLYHRTQNWEGLLSVFDLEVAAVDDPRQKAARMYKAAEILEKQLRREEEAIARYNHCLQLQPGYLPAQQALIRLYERQGRYSDLVAMYEQEIAQTSEKDQTVSTLNKMAVIYEERLSDIDRAIECMKRIVELVPDHLPTLRNLARMFEYSGRWRELIEIHEKESAMAGDTKEVLSLHHRNAEILEEQLGDTEGAIAAYQGLLSLSPAYLPALKALGRLYTERGNWTELVKMYRAEAEIAPAADQTAALLFRAGALIERKLGDPDQAIAAYREVLRRTPSYLPALRALEHIYRSRKDWEQLLGVLRDEASNRSDPGERADALLQAAGILESQLNQQDAAIASYQEVLRLSPDHPWAIAGLKRLYAAQGNVQELVVVLEREAQSAETDAGRIAGHLKLAQIYLDRLNEPSRAGQACEAVLAIDPSNVYALKMLERAKTSDSPRTSELRLKLAGGVSDQRLQAALKLAACSEDGIADEGTLQQLRQAFAEDPGDPRLRVVLERALRRAGEDEGLLDLYETLGRSTADPLEKLGLLFRIADLAEHRLRQPAKALDAYRAALELNPQLVPALQGASRTAMQVQDYAAAKEALEAEGKASRDVRGALEAFVAAGRLCVEHLLDPQAAIGNFRRALERDPTDPIASAALRGLLEGGQSEDLARFHERAAEAKLAQRELSAAASEFLLAAKTWLEKANDPAKALRAVERSLAIQPSNADALEMKGKLALDAHQFGEAAAAYAARVQLGGEAEALLPLHLRLGALYQEHLSDPTRAAAHYQTVLAAQPHHLEALERLAALHSSARNWSGAADCLKALLELETQPSALARHSVALAKIYQEGFSNPTLASSLYRRALGLAPGDLWIVERLTDLYERVGNPAELVQLLEQQAQQGGDAKQQAALRVKIGDLYGKSLDDDQKAVASYRLALQRDPACLAAQAALADLYMRDAAAAPSAIDAHRQLLLLEPTRVESIHALFRLWEGLRQSDKAFCAAGLLRFMRAATEAELAFHSSGCNRLETARPQPLSDSQLNALIHPSARGPLLEVLRAIGDQLAKQYPPDFNALGINRRSARLKSDHPLLKTVQTLARILQAGDFEAYKSPRGWVSVEMDDPFAVCICEEALDKLPRPEQRFLIGRALFAIRNKTAIANKLPGTELGDLMGAAIRIFVPDFYLIGRLSDELTKQVARNCSRRARKALEVAVEGVSNQAAMELDRWIEGLSWSMDRAGLLVSGDVCSVLNLAMREGTASAADRTAAEPVASIKRRPRLEQLVAFALSDEHFELRARLGIAV